MLVRKIKEHMKIIIPFLIFIGFLFLGCEKDEVDINGLGGSWVEGSAHLDTLTFHENNVEGLLTLDRPKEMRNGHHMPMGGAGMYFFTLKEDSILLQNSISSCYCPKSYAIKYQKNQDVLRIGNFYHEGFTEGGSMLFERL